MSVDINRFITYYRNIPGANYLAMALRELQNSHNQLEEAIAKAAASSAAASNAPATTTAPAAVAPSVSVTFKAGSGIGISGSNPFTIYETGGIVEINGKSTLAPNFNSSLPAAPATQQNVAVNTDANVPVDVSFLDPVMLGDTGSGGKAGNVPAPATGDAAKFLRGDATWAAASGSDYVVMSNGAEPPTPMDDGAGDFMYVGYTP